MKFARPLLSVIAAATSLTLLVSCTSGPSEVSTPSPAVGSSLTTSAAGTTPDTATGPTGTSSTPTSSTSTTSTSTTPTVPAAQVTATPALGTDELSPTDAMSVAVTGGTLSELTLTNPDGKVVAGELNADRTSWTLGEELGYGKTYTLAGSATNAAGAATPISGTWTTVDPADTARTIISPGDGETVGVAAPVEVRFGVEPADRAAVEKAISITTTPAVEGAWAWIQHDDGLWALDYRPKEYWPAGTTVHVQADVYGVSFGDGYWGREDVTSDFTIGRNQVVKADVNSHELVVQRDGVTVATYPASYGRGTNADLTTRSGIHVVNEFFEEKLMSNPKYGYVDQLEKWAVRISDNGEFIHANPNSVDAQGNTNVSHGCVNLSLAHAEEYYKSAMWGDPVEVTGTDVTLSAEDGDIYDWAVPWDEWVTMSGKNA
ncbi:L,D-transpeptidase [Nakamurella deserti]|uniref:L,D-transpeptidase n=1 Tax=Nakamurella deserti TaxID=2164074 RepID=UPI000DBE6A3C|nr:Ig-like domain-containing protein [Nakamurella deserti]